MTGCLHPHVALIGDAPAQLQRKCRSCGQAFGLCQRHGIYPQLDAAGCPKCLPLAPEPQRGRGVPK